VAAMAMHALEKRESETEEEGEEKEEDVEEKWRLRRGRDGIEGCNGNEEEEFWDARSLETTRCERSMSCSEDGNRIRAAATKVSN
jgi:hypothetical protein